MYSRSRSQAFRNALLWTWWLPLVVAVVAGAVKYVPEMNQPNDWLTFATIRLTLADGGVPDKSTMEAHVKILQSSTVAESAKAKVKEAYPDLHSFQQSGPVIRASSGEDGVLVARASGLDAKPVETFLDEGMNTYLNIVKWVRLDPRPGDELILKASPTILKQAEPAIEQQNHPVLAALFFAAIPAGVIGFVSTLVLCGLWVWIRPARIPQ
ncbi:hypothetical protein [Roseimicrobium sp. ORNL1]|uniref:hypothetical protein n=1 Tax=Roseimicrobium sp. ORNL1 TaxID=2711231 RepID=UPI0013E17D00|nr:hypothetical protein [Roseimicrobium sp. ORNL1]QIF03456.1 hypothetical protein G5S37_18630 [Roseimicrobium sp. ORNL1]